MKPPTHATPPHATDLQIWSRSFKFCFGSHQFRMKTMKRSDVRVSVLRCEEGFANSFWLQGSDILIGTNIAWWSSKSSRCQPPACKFRCNEAMHQCMPASVVSTAPLPLLLFISINKVIEHLVTINLWICSIFCSSSQFLLALRVRLRLQI